MKPELRRFDSRFGDDNPLLLLSLGLLSTLDRARRWVDDHAPAPGGGGGAGDETDALAIEFVLGLLSARAVITRRLEAAASSTNSEPSPCVAEPRGQGSFFR